MKIDTSTTAGKIAVMQAFADGKIVQFKNSAACGWDSLEPGDQPMWCWNECDYRIKPQTVEEAAKHQDRVFKNDAERSEYQLGFVTGAEWQKSQMIEDIISEQDRDND